MRFGWLTLSLSPSPEEDAVRIDQQIEQVRFAERLGFGDVWLTEHYFTGESVYNDALLFASAVAMRTERIRIGFAVVQLPFHHPVRLAVQLALLDNLSKGRIDVGVGKGTIYNEYEFVGHGLRSRVALQVDGQMKTGRDVVVAALLGADEFAFATAPLVAAGCVMMRVCHLNTCPVGIATQDPELRKQFAGKPEFVINFFRFIAKEVREYMAGLGFRTIDEMVGRVDCLKVRSAIDHWKAKGLDYSAILQAPKIAPGVARRRTRAQDHGLEQALDNELIPACARALEHRQPVVLSRPIRNVHRAVGTMLGYEVTRRWGGTGLPDDTITVRFTGSAGQSFGAFVPRGITLTLEGDANDYAGKGLSGGRIVLSPPRAATFAAEHNVIAGNVALYGATSGEAFIRGIAGERFAVRNSGATAVVEGVGDHGCEYMTGGRVIVLGRTGRNFAAGMSGGIAYVLNATHEFERRCNPELVDLEPLDHDDLAFVLDRIARHVELTGSALGARLLAEWSSTSLQFTKVMPRDYKRALATTMPAFEPVPVLNGRMVAHG